MKVSHKFVEDSAVFDEDRIGSCAGLVPVMMLTEWTRLTGVLAEKMSITTTKIAYGAGKHGTETSDTDRRNVRRRRLYRRPRRGSLRRHEGLFGNVHAPSNIGTLLREFTSVMMAKNTAIQRVIDSIADDAWAPVKYPGAVRDPDTGAWIFGAEVAETSCTAFTSADTPVTVRLIVRRVTDARFLGFPCGGIAPFFRHVALPTATADVTHRRYSIIFGRAASLWVTTSVGLTAATADGETPSVAVDVLNTFVSNNFRNILASETDPEFRKVYDRRRDRDSRLFVRHLVEVTNRASIRSNHYRAC
ncbi:hypothetical protein BDB13_5744 [Rhodococcus sp. OK302]|nr:hypothetical protein BDB13_5744 [Rhodococcus sp. OK302]